MYKTHFRVLMLTIVLSALGFAQAPVDEKLLWVPDINGLAITLVKPAFPETAVAVGADGAPVLLRVIVDESGNVVSANCSTTCHPMLKDAAELAAIQSKFKPQMKDGRPARYEGTLQYTFVVKHVSWYRFGTAIESAVQFDNISLGPVADILSSDYAAEKAKLLTLDARGVDFDTRQRVMAEVIATIKTKLKGTDLWRFGMAIALRRVTFWAQAGERTDRAAMQKAIDALPGHIAAAPEGVSERTIQALTAVSRYRVTPEISERELRVAIVELAKHIPNDLK